MNRVKTGDLVYVISGRQKGKTAKVLRVMPKEERVVLEGLNKVKRHKKPTKDNPKGQIVDIEAPIHLSNVMPIDSSTGKPTRVSMSVQGDKKVRVGRSKEPLKV